MIKNNRPKTCIINVEYPINKEGWIRVISIEAKTKREFELKYAGVVLALTEVLGISDSDITIGLFALNNHKWFQ